MVGLRAMNFQLYPQKFAYLFANRARPLTERVLTSDWLNVLLVPFLCYATLTAVEPLHDLMVLPAVLWFGLASSALFMSQHLLLAPLWLTRTFQFFTAFALLTSLTFCYRAVANKIEYHQMGASIGNVQRQLDREREVFEGSGQTKDVDTESARIYEEYQKMMRDLKDPLI